jgi:hypothetical protein
MMNLYIVGVEYSCAVTRANEIVTMALCMVRSPFNLTFPLLLLLLLLLVCLFVCLFVCL